jgi:hypothetical protein
MKKLGTEEIINMTLGQAWDIAGEFGEYIADNPPKFLEFDNVLPYRKDIILLALVKILVKQDFKVMAKASGQSEETIKENIATNIQVLESFIPTKENYNRKVQNLLSIKEKFK